MGAIYGLIGDVDASLLRVMGDRLRHRGKARAEWSDGNVSLGMWAHGATTEVLTDENISLVVDADIYNGNDIRKQQTEEGFTRSKPQPEDVILLGYKAFGFQICEKLIGDFSFALWDRAHNSLFLARDALGSRPLFYWTDDKVFAFASEYKALLALPFVPATVDLEALQHLQYTKYPPENRTLLEDVFSVPAGCYATYRGGRLRKERYWRVELDVIDAPEQYHVNTLREQFLKVIERQVGDASEIGVTLSGGVDSAAIVAAAKEVKPDITLHTFTCGYGPDDPEVRSAEVVAKAVNTIHHNIFITPQDISDGLRRLVWHLEDPIARTETVLNFETARYASQYVDVVLAGHAGDGLFGGMPRHKLIRLMEWFPPLKTPIEEFYNYTQFSALPETFLGKALRFGYYRGADALPPKVRGVELDPPTSKLPSARKELLNRVLLGGAFGGVAKWLPKVDRTHMAYGLQYRSPFTDVELIRCSFQIPDRYKIRGWREKHIFREAVRPLLPSEVLNRPKFPQAMQYDLELSRVLDKLADEILSPQEVEERGFFSVTDIERLRYRRAEEAYSPEQLMRLWTIILTELWARIFVDGRANLSCA